MSHSHEFIYNQNGISIMGVKEVYEFSDKEIFLGLQEGGLKIQGSDLKLVEVDLEKGSLKASGALLSISYGGNTKESIIKKLFK